jgi:PAS domain S-box-containing protein
MLSSVYIAGIFRNKYFTRQVKIERENLVKIKQLEDTVQRKDEKFYQIYNNSPDMIAIIQKEGYIITDVNNTAVKVLGYPKKDIIGKNLFNTPVIFEDDKKQLKEKVDYSFSHPEEIVECTIRKISKEKDVLHIYERMFVLKNSGNNSLLMTCQNITEEVHARKEKECMEEKYKRIIDNITDVVFELDKNLNFTYINSAIMNLTDYEPSDLLGRSVLDFILSDKEILSHEFKNRIIFTDKKPKTRTLPIVCKNDSIVIFDITTSISFVDQNHPKGVYGIARDVTTEKKKLALRKMKIAKKSDEFLDKLNDIERTLSALDI